MFWKVRPKPARARCQVFSRLNNLVSSKISALSALVTPVMQLTIVDLPEPFGPINPEIFPRST